jgi:hypothetical protein
LARDREGNLGSESKLIADEITTITDSDISGYQSTGGAIAAPKMSSKVKREKREEYKVKRSGEKPAAAKPKDSPSSGSTSQPVQPRPEELVARLYIHVKDPDNHQALVELKSLCSKYPGATEVVLVIGESSKSAIKLPFKVDAGSDLVSSLNKLLGENCVVAK